MNTNNGNIFGLTSAIVIALFSIVFCLVSATAALQKSPTFDEPLHLYAGYSYLKWGDFRVNPEHPPLAKVLAALPLLFMNIDASGISRAQRDVVQYTPSYGWVLADRFLASNHDVDRFFFSAKLVMIGFAVTLGVFVFLWARELYGLSAGIAALVIYGLDPNIIAHSSIVHTDIPFTLFFFAGTYWFWRTSNHVTWVNALSMSICFALSTVTKFSFLVVLPIWAILGTFRVFSSEPQMSQITSPPLVDRRSQKAVLLVSLLSMAIIVAYCTVWAAYGFRFDAVANEKGQMAVGRLLAAESWLRPLVGFNSKYFGLPEAWVYGLAYTFRSLDRSSYLLGVISNHGFWLYFPIAFAVKTPLPTLMMIVVALGLMVLRRRLRMADLFLLVPVIIFFAVAVWSKLNIGLRHILPIYPFLFVWLGGSAATILKTENRIAKGGVLLLSLWLVGASYGTYPNYLAFFNELAGGSINGHKILVDSNLDWGQDLKGLKRWMDDQGISRIHFAYFGTVDPFYYGIKAVPEPGSLFFKREDSDHSPAAPYLAVSATYLAGLYLPQSDTYASFRNKRPVASIGNSILIYRMDETR